MTNEEKLIREITVRLSDVLDKDNMKLAKHIVESAVYHYNVEEKTTELVEYTGNVNHKIICTYKAFKGIEGKSEKTLAKYEFDLWKLFDFINKDFDKISTNDIRYFMSQYQLKGGRKLTNTTMDNMRKTYSAFFNWCKCEGYISESPMDRIANIKRDTIKEKAYTAEEQEAMIYAADGIRNETILYFMQSTGCRVSEVSGMDISDIDWTARMITVRHGKGNKSRVVPMDGRLIFLLKQYFKWREKKNITVEALFVCGKNHKKRLSKSGLEYIVSEIAQKAGVEHAHPHRYRATWITSLLAKGMKLEEVQIIAGHEDINTTVGYNRSDISSINEKFKRIA